MAKHYHFEAWIDSVRSGRHPANVTVGDIHAGSAWSISDSFDGVDMEGTWGPGHGHGRSPAGIVCLQSGTIIFELDDFIPMYDSYSVATGISGRFLNPHRELKDRNFTWTITRVHET